jgi:lactoylglutathione lyase
MRTVIFCIIAQFLYPVFISAQPVQDISARINHIAITVTDLQLSETFYRDFIGLKQIPEPFNVGRHAWFDIGSAELHVIKALEERRQPDREIGTHLCFSIKEMDAFMTKLDENGIRYSDFEGNVGQVQLRPDGIRQIYFTDPDGYWIEINDDF